MTQMKWKDKKMVKCVCGGELKSLSYSKDIVQYMERNYIETDFFICLKCESIYKRIIKNKVYWNLMVEEK
jgi:hypothetical protein